MPIINKTTKPSTSKKPTRTKFTTKPTAKATSKPAVKTPSKSTTKTTIKSTTKLSVKPTFKPVIKANTTSQKAEFIKKIATQAEEQKPTLSRTTKKEMHKIPVRVWVFFGASLLLFCIALYQAILRPSLTTTLDQPTDTPEIIVSDNQNEWGEVEQTQVPEFDAQTAGGQFLQQFYQTFSQKDSTALLALFDAPLQKSTEIRQFFSNYKMVPFIDNISNNSISPENIELISTSPSGVEEYRYNLNYHLVPTNEDFAETRVAKVRFIENNEGKIASIRCESTRCSYNPFFRPESYGLVK
ncbi:MAG: hypothetical protein LBD11_05530 [Candidatus Peribacteria bacterium]|jgi:hypothetical protein|nr:hypothetical protein [Candidatus Peribacteria bacterium]